MRPRVFPAEDAVDFRDIDRISYASMRPRVFPAEDLTLCGGSLAGWWRFNEAAGIPRGRLTVRIVWPYGAVASMRPRVFPAEDA